MHQFIKRTAAGAILAAFALSAGAAQAAPVTASATAKAKILKAITVNKTADLDFGTIVVGSTGGTVQVDTAATPARTCAAALTCSASFSPASFGVTGTGSAVVTVSTDASVTLTNGTNTMTASLAKSAGTVTLAANGTGSFGVGGTLTVGANQADGAYSGTFNVSVDYQ